MKIAIIGSGISSLTIAYLAQINGHEIFLYEKNDYFGGHSNTVEIEVDNQKVSVDTGFLVHNDLTYPNFIQMMKLIDAKTYDSNMTLSVKIESEKIEWGGESIKTVFSQKKNIFNLRFWRMIKDILAFNQKSFQYRQEIGGSLDLTLGQFLKDKKYSKYFIDWYIVPMAASIWSTPVDKILDYPAATFFNFCLNHRLLQVNDRPIWKTMLGGSKIYVKKITDLLQNKKLNSDVESVETREQKVFLRESGQVSEFDLVVFGCHADTSMKLLRNATATQKEILEKFKFQKNLAYLHSDVSVLPEDKKIWSAWNYLSSRKKMDVCVTYYLNDLQNLNVKQPICVTLNPHEPLDSKKIFKVIEYEHPIFDAQAIRAQKMIETINGDNNVYFVGAWQGYGFHEDGVKSALRVARKLNFKIPWDAVYE